MLGYNGHVKITATVAVSASASTALPISGYNKIAIECPAMTNLVAASAQVNVYVAQAAADTFRPLASIYNDASLNSSYNWVISNCVGNQIVVCEPLAGFNFCKIVVSISATAAAGWPVVLHCMQ